MGEPNRPFPNSIVEEVGLISLAALGNSMYWGESSLFVKDLIWPEHRYLGPIPRRDVNLFPLTYNFSR
jgi:hypothetical protein